MTCYPLGKPPNGYLCIDRDRCEKHDMGLYGYPCFGCQLEREGESELAAAFTVANQSRAKRAAYSKLLNAYYDRQAHGG